MGERAPWDFHNMFSYKFTINLSHPNVVTYSSHMEAPSGFKGIEIHTWKFDKFDKEISHQGKNIMTP